MENECQVSACAVTAEEAHGPLGLSPTRVIFDRCSGPGRPEGRGHVLPPGFTSSCDSTWRGVEWLIDIG